METPENPASQNPSTDRSSGSAEARAGGDGEARTRGRVVDQDIGRELQDSYLTYAMSTIMDRALPDVRDGLKPSQRRILVAMNDLNLRPGKKHYKCAKIAGDTSGNYHPHGEQVVYPTLVFMAQKWRMRVPLIDPQGNFGSILGDPPAAARYTEARMAYAAVDMLADLTLGTVDFQPNYDDRLQEPTVLPGRFPNLLVNGGIGIAVGMATSLAPHNPTEILDSIIRVIENPGIGFAELMQDVLDASGAVVRRGVKGPDFPTGGVVLGRRGIVDAYSTGRGKVTVRGTVRVEKIDGKSDRDMIVIESIPYMVNQTTLVEKIVEAVNDDRMQDVSYVNDESNRDAPTKVVLHLKKGADPRVVEKQLYEFTPLQETFSINNLALVNRQPRTMSLRQLIDCYVSHREEVIRRRTGYLLREARKRAHVLEGMIYAVCDIDEVIRIIRSSATREQAIERLMEKRFQIPSTHPHAAKLPKRLVQRLTTADGSGEAGVLLSRIQAETIGGMRLIQLVGLEIEKLLSEYLSVSGEIDDLESILASRERVLSMVKADCEEMRARFDVPRVTAIDDAGVDIDIAELIPVQDVALTISRDGYAKRVPLDTYRSQGRGGRGIKAGETKDEDFLEHVFVASTHDDLLCFTDTGRVFKIKVFEVPEMGRTSKGRALVNLLDLKVGEGGVGEKCRAFLNVKNFEEGSEFLTFVSRQGVIKRTALKEYRNVNKSGLIAVGLKEGDALLDVTLTRGADDILLATAGGMAIRFNEQDARLMGRSAAGVKGIELDEGDEVIGVVAVPMNGGGVGEAEGSTSDAGLCLLTITEHGYGKRTPVDEYRVQSEDGTMRSQSRGGKGRIDIKTSDRNGKAVAALGVHAGDDVMVVSKGGQLVRTKAGAIRETGRAAQGVRVVTLDSGDRVIAAARIADGGEGKDEGEGESAGG